MIKVYRSVLSCAVLFLLIGCAKRDVAERESSPAEQLTMVLPDDVLGFAATSGGDYLKPAFEKSILGRMWYDPGVQSFYQSIRKEVVEKIKLKVADPKVGEASDIVVELFKLAQKRPIVVGAARKEVGKGPPVYGFGILDAGTYKTEIASAVAKLEALADEGDIIEINVGSYKMHGPRDSHGVPGYWGWVGNYFVFAINDGEGRVLKYLSKPRAAVPEYLKQVSGTGEVLAAYFDYEAAFGLANSLATYGGDMQQLNVITAAIKELGFGNVKSCATRIGFEESDIVSHGFLALRQPRAGLCATLQPIDVAMFDMVNAGAINAAGVNCDVAGVYDTTMRAIKAAVPKDIYDEIQENIASFESEAQIELRKGLLENLAGPVVFYSLPAGVMIDVPSGGAVVIAKPRDARALEKTLAALGKYAAGHSGGMLQVSSHVQSDGRTYYNWVIAPLAMMQVLPCWTIVNDHLVVASNTALCSTAVKQVGSTGPAKKSIRGTEGFKKATAKLPKDLVLLSYTDTKVQFNQMMIKVQQFWPMLTMVAAKAGVNLPVMLPSVGDIVKDMGPTCQYCWFDAEGLRSRYQGPGFEAGVATVAPIGAAVLMPALHKARTQAKQTVSRTNMHQIALVLKMYSDDHDGNFPKTLVEAKPYYHDERLLESPLKPKGFAGPSYIYIAHKTPNIKSAGRYIVIYENPEYSADKINALFLDYSVRMMGQKEFLETLEETYKHLGKEMPEIKFMDYRRGRLDNVQPIPAPTEE